MSISLPTSQVIHLVHPKPFSCWTLVPIVIQLQDPTKYITQTQYPLSLQSFRSLKLISSDLLRKKGRVPLSFRGHQDQLICFLFCSTLLDWEPYSFLSDSPLSSLLSVLPIYTFVFNDIFKFPIYIQLLLQEPPLATEPEVQRLSEMSR